MAANLKAHLFDLAHQGLGAKDGHLSGIQDGWISLVAGGRVSSDHQEYRENLRDQGLQCNGQLFRILADQAHQV